MHTPPCVSFIGIVDFSQEAKWIYMTDSVTDLLGLSPYLFFILLLPSNPGFEPHELVGRPSLELVHPDELGRVKQLHYDTINQDKAAVLAYLRMRHKDPYKGYVLCGIVRSPLFSSSAPPLILLLLLPLLLRTVVHNVLVGSVSFASPGAKALQNASTAQEITVISPSAQNFQFRVRFLPSLALSLALTFSLSTPPPFVQRWHDPSPIPHSPVPISPPLTSPWQSPSPCSSPSPASTLTSSDDHTQSTNDHYLKHLPITFDHLPNQSFRTALILDRFSLSCTILYCSNDLLISTTDCIGRSFFDYVAKRDEHQVTSWVNCVKGWGVNERGQPSDGGFGFGKFLLITEGRDSIRRIPDPVSRRSRYARSSAHPHLMTSPTRHRPRPRGHNHDSSSPPLSASMNDVNSPQFPVDAIFSAHSDGLMVILRRATAS
ncbi:hypothetical protein Ac2012v2_005869 [Leucoagaricus gongylophorus]